MARHFRADVIRPTLKDIQHWSPAAENLLLGTALAESELTALHQEPDGPAKGFYQMETLTHLDLWRSWLMFRPAAAMPLLAEITGAPPADAMRQAVGEGWKPPHDLLVTNLRYATMAARLQYWRRPEALPEADDIEGLARYWKAWWNTLAGKGTPAKFVALYRKYGETYDAT